MCELDGATAKAVAAALSDLGFYRGTPPGEFGETDRAALDEFRVATGLENRSLSVLEDALARGWDDANGSGERRLLDAIHRGLSRLDRN